MLAIYTETRAKRYSNHSIRQKIGNLYLRRTIGLDSLSYNAIVDYMDYGRGSAGILAVVVQNLADTLGVRPEPEASDLDDILGDLTGSRVTKSLTLSFTPIVPVKLRCNDGNHVLVHRPHDFTFIVDFLSEHPGTTTIALDFPSKVVHKAVNGSTLYKLGSCLEVVQFLNPVSNVYYLEFDLSGMPVELLKTLAGRLTASERAGLILADKETRLAFEPGLIKHLPLPANGDGYKILAALSSVRTDRKLSAALFHEHPSWLICNRLVDGIIVDRETFNLLLTLPFATEADADFFYDGISYDLIAKTVRELLVTHAENWDEASYLLAMLGVRSKDLLNDELDVFLPYGASSAEEIGTPFSSQYISKLASLYPGVWRDSYYTEARRRM